MCWSDWFLTYVLQFSCFLIITFSTSVHKFVVFKSKSNHQIIHNTYVSGLLSSNSGSHRDTPHSTEPIPLDLAEHVLKKSAQPWSSELTTMLGDMSISLKHIFSNYLFRIGPAFSSCAAWEHLPTPGWTHPGPITAACQWELSPAQKGSFQQQEGSAQSGDQDCKWSQNLPFHRA